MTIRSFVERVAEEHGRCKNCGRLCDSYAADCCVRPEWTPADFVAEAKAILAATEGEALEKVAISAYGRMKGYTTYEDAADSWNHLHEEYFNCGKEFWRKEARAYIRSWIGAHA